MKITSTAFEHNGTIPERYTCDGEERNPPLQFEDIPNNAASLALIVSDPDAVGKKPFYHWVVFNIGPSTDHVEEDSVPGTVSAIGYSPLYLYTLCIRFISSLKERSNSRRCYSSDRRTYSRNGNITRSVFSKGISKVRFISRQAVVDRVRVPSHLASHEFRLTFNQPEGSIFHAGVPLTIGQKPIALCSSFA